MPPMDPVSTEFQLSTVTIIPLIVMAVVLALAVRMTIQQRLWAPESASEKQNPAAITTERPASP